MSATVEAPDHSGVIEIPISELRDKLGETVDQVDRDDQFVYITRHGRRIGAIMPADIAEHYEQIEDDYWARRADEVRAAATTSEEPPIPWEQAVAELETDG